MSLQLASAMTIDRTIAGEPEISLRIEGEPVGKGRPRVTRTGVAYTPAKTRAYEAKVRRLADAAAVSLGLPEGGVTGKVLLFLRLFLNRPHRMKGSPPLEDYATMRGAGRPDLDNVIKTVLDACEGVLYRNDCQVVQIWGHRVWADRSYVIARLRLTTGDS